MAKTAQIIFRVAPEKKRKLQVYAINHDTTVQALLERAVEEIIRKDDGK